MSSGMIVVGTLLVMASILTKIFSCMNLCFPQEGNGQSEIFSFSIYLCYLVYAPLYIAGPILSFNAFASQVSTNSLLCLKFLSPACEFRSFYATKIYTHVTEKDR